MKAPQHRRVELTVFGRYYEPLVDAVLDRPDELIAYGNKHRKVSHTWERINAIRLLLGELAYKQAIVHVFCDYGIISDDLLQTLSMKRTRKPRSRIKIS